MAFKLIKKLENGIRIGELNTPHGKIETPFFMPVGTVGSVKATAPWELEEMGAQILLSNTYHLYLRPGEQLIKNFGGLHQFIGWDKPILTDSGGYQVFSLSDCGGAKGQSLVKITDDGVEFKSHLDGNKHFFTPEKVIDIQLDLGVDILMPLDVCPSGKASKDEVKEACNITIAWAKRARKHFNEKIKDLPEDKKPMLHGIVQGGLYEDLRRECADALIDLDFDGYSIGGLAVDLETRNMWDIVQQMGEILPENKQRYLMGVGTPDDIIKGVMRGVDMFDCVLPTRMARHGNVYVKNTEHGMQNTVKFLPMPEGELEGVGDSFYSTINLLNSQYRTDAQVIDEKCGCEVCKFGQGFSRAYISHLLRSKEILGLRLTTLHNLWQYLELMRILGRN